MNDISKSAKAAAILVFTSGVEDVDTALKLYNQLEEDNIPVKNTLDKFFGVTRWSVVSDLSDGSWWDEIQMLAQNIDNFRKRFGELIEPIYDEPAFPITEESRANTTLPGMTLRDYFAAKAMQSYLLDKDRDSFTYEQWAHASYKMADAMLKARKKNHE